MADAVAAESPDSGDAVVATVDGRRLADLIASLPLSRGSVFELVKALGIATTKGPGPEGRGRVAWVSSADAMRLEDAAAEVAAGRLRIADAGGGGALAQRRQTPQTMADPAGAESPDSGDGADGAALFQRLQVAEASIRSGFPLSTAELAWLLGVRPGSPVVTRAGLRAVRLARNLWRLEQAAESPDSGDGARR